jgi:hypothetical protein
MARENSWPAIIVQRLATGLQDFIGSKATGDTPHSLSRELVAVVDGGLFLGAGRYLNTFAATGAFIGKTNVFGPIVPAGEMWLVHNICATGGPVTAGASIGIQLGIYRQQASAEMLPEVKDFAAGDDIALGHWFERPAVMMPGDRPCALSYKFTGVPNFAINLSVGYIRVVV